MNNYTRGEWTAEWGYRNWGNGGAGIKKDWQILCGDHRTNGEPVIACIPDGRLDRAEEANAKRIAALHNACERAGITNPDALPELVEAAQFWADRNTPGINEGPCFVIKEALRNLKES